MLVLGITIVVFVFITYIFIERMYPHKLRIPITKARELIQTHGAKVVDVRTQAEWNSGHYKGAIHIPVSKIRELAPKKLDRTDMIVLYCNTGTRARNAVDVFQELGYKNISYIAETYHEL